MTVTLADRARDIARDFAAAFQIPGLAIALVRGDDEPVLLTHGVRALDEPDPVDIDTQFAIASNSKAFLAACLAIEVDHGRIGWDDPVVRHLPEFRMSDPAVTRMMTVRDLLVHRSGLPLGAGDLMLIRAGRFTADQVLAALPHFPTAGFRAGYAYDNCLYIVAGLLLERVAGLSWNDHLATNIFGPLGMTSAVGNPSLVRSRNRAGRHARLGPPVIGMGPLERIAPQESDVNGPAGGINASIRDILPWLRVQLGHGAIAEGKRLWSEAQTEEMWAPQTIIASGPGPSPEAPQRAVVEAYALGWGVNDYRGQRMLTHAGMLAGATSRVALLPDAGIGIAVFSNAADGEPISALRYALLDLLLGTASFDWIGQARATIAGLHALVETVTARGVEPLSEEPPSLPIGAYVGRYVDPWYGEIAVTSDGDTLDIDFLPTPGFAGPLITFGGDSFRTHFPRGVGEDAIVSFEVANGAVTGLRMKALSPLADFSFDYHHLSFAPAPLT